MQLFILVNGAQEGPFTPDQIKGYLAMGHFHHNDLAWHEGMEDWKPLEQFPEFAPRAHRTPNYGKMPIRKAAQQKKKKSNNLLATVLLLVIILGAAGAGGYYYWHQQQQKKAAEAAARAAAAQAAQAAAQAKGPETAEELNRWYEEPPSGQNAAVFFQKGFDALQITDADTKSYSLPLIGKAQLPAFSSAIFGTMKTSLQDFLQRNQPALDLFLQGADCSGSRYPVDLAQGAKASLPHLAKIKQAAQLGELDALGQADAIEGAGAGQGVLVALAAARTLDSEPLLISQLVRVACEGMAVDALEQAVNRVTLPPETLAKLKGAFDRAADYEAAGTGFDRALVGERVAASATADLPSEKLPEKPPTVPPGGPPGARPVAARNSPSENLKEQRQFYADSLDQMLAARKDPLPARLKADELAVSRANEARAKGDVVAATMLPALGRVTSKEAAGLARLRLAQTALALEGFRAAHANRYPDSLSELAPKFLPAVLNDPFDGQPLRYRKSGEGFVLYSVGPDLRDEGGARRGGSDDLAFTVLRPPKAP